MVNQTNNANPSNSGGQPGHAIDKLLDFCVANDGTAYYQVKWKPTWERADALLQFTGLIDSFWEFVNNAHKGNLYNNQSLIQGYPPDLPTSLASNVNVNVGLVPNSTPSKPKQKKNTKATPQKQVKAFNPPQKRKPIQTPTKPMIVEAVVIDSDDEDVAEVAPSSLQNASLGQSMTSFQGQQQLQPANYSSASSIWNMNIQTKTEPTDIPDQKPFQQQNHVGGGVNDFNQPHQIGLAPAIPQPLSQQQFPIPAQNTKPVSSIRGRGGGRGRGRGTVDPGTKRKLDHSNNNPNQLMHQVKFESQDDATTSTQSIENFGNNWESLQGYDNESSMSDDGGKWENSFEIIEKKNFDGTSLETQYKCTICGTVISNKSSCSRHYNIHSGQKSHKCPICDKAFHRMDYMQRHLKVHGQGGGKELEGLIKLAMEGVKK